MITHEMIENILLDNKNISEIRIQKDKEWHEKKYDFVVHCKIDILNDWVPIVIGINKFWKIRLFDFYLVDIIKGIPHLEENGKLCLFNLEGKMIIPNFEGVLNQSILRVKKIITEGLSGQNKDDFFEEFYSYFSILPDAKNAKAILSIDKRDNIIKFVDTNQYIKSKFKRNKSISKKINQKFFIGSTECDFSNWKIQGTQKNGIYCYIEPSEKIYPPTQNTNIKEYLEKLLSFVNFNNFEKNIKKCGEELLIVFEIKQLNNIFNFCGFLIDKRNLLYNNKFELKSERNIYPINIKKIDKNSINSRVDFSLQKISDKKILLIGCGSIGGYVFYNLIKMGCKNITLIDNDIFKEENISRHFLGLDSIDEYKTKALIDYAKKVCPYIINIEEVVENIEDVLEEKMINLNNFDYIVSAIGDHKKNLYINEYMLENNIEKTFFYIWNEPLDIGCHVLRINIKNGKNYKALFEIKEGRNIDLSSYVKSGQSFIRSHSGCGGTFVPYGPILSIESSIIFANLFKRELENRIEKNLIVSKKGDDYYLSEAGFVASDRYINQKEIMIELSLNDLKKEKSC